MPKFSSLADLAKKEETGTEGKGDETKGNEFYTGGNDSRGGGSGLNVLDPMDRLESRASRQSKHAEGAKKLTMYKNGIVIDDGPFRPLDDTRTKEIMNELAAGRVPIEMQVSDSGSDDVEVVLIDKKTELYTPPFESDDWNNGATGCTLGTSGQVVDKVGYRLVDIDDQEVVLDSSPSTTIQLKLANGKKIKIKLNHKHTIMDILRLMKRETSLDATFTISAGFPPVLLDDPSASLQEANVIGASIVYTSL